MIFEEFPNTDPINLLFMATKVDIEQLPVRIEGTPVNFCYCNIECDYIEKAFANPATGDPRENDKTSFLLRLFIPTDTIVFKIFKAGVEVATIVDNTYGEFFAPGDLTVPENPDSSLYTGFIADWELIFNAFGAGIYEIKMDTDIVGGIRTLTSHKFKLMVYSELAANGTVLIKAFQNGNILSNPLNYTGLNWEQRLRLPGRFTGKRPDLVIDRYQDGELELKQIQDNILNSYTLDTKMIPFEIANLLIYDFLLANRILVTDYNLINEDVINCEKTYNEISVYPDEIAEPEPRSRTVKRNYSFTFVDKVQNIRKRNK